MRKKIAKEKKERGEIVRICPEYTQGLSEWEAKERAEKGWRNVEVNPPALTIGEIIYNNVFTYFNLIFTVLAVLLCLVGSFKNLTFVPVILGNTLIGIIQEIRSKKALEKLSMLNARKAEVIRDGKSYEIEADQLVLDDITVFRSGNQICADAIVVEGEVRVNESLLTGESDEIKKTVGDFLLSGSFVVNGKCHAKLEKVGEDSYISKLTLEAKEMKTGEQSEMMRSLNKLVKIVGIALIPIGAILFAQGYFFNDESMKESIVSMVAAVIGMIPEGLYLLASVALAVGALRLARNKVMLHDMKSIETLARVDVLCVDKTGTITEDKMSVSDFYGIGDYKDRKEELNTLISNFVRAMDADNGTMEAMKSYFKEAEDVQPKRVIPFSSRVKYSGVVYDNGAYILGAPEILLGKEYEAYRKNVEEYSKEGYRVLLFGTTDEMSGEPLKNSVAPLAYILLTNKIRENASETFAYFAEQGVEIKVISGDNPITVSKTAQMAGIKGAEKFIDASKLTPDTIEDAVKSYTVFGRVTPEQKKEFVEILKANGRTVAMTGDGVNDVLALKKADCGVAMASGSDAAVQASQVVLLESDFSKMPAVVLEGRRVVNNIQRSASLFLVKNIFSILLALLAVGFATTYPFEPSQITLIGMFTIGTPGFFLALQPNKERIKGNFLMNVTLKALPTGLADAILVCLMVTVGNRIAIGENEIATAATLVVAIVGLQNLYKVCQPMDLIRSLIWGGCILGFLFCVIFMPWFFAISELSKAGITLFLSFAVLSAPLLKILTMIIEKVQKEKGVF